MDIVGVVAALTGFSRAGAVIFMVTIVVVAVLGPIYFSVWRRAKRLAASNDLGFLKTEAEKYPQGREANSQWYDEQMENADRALRDMD